MSNTTRLTPKEAAVLRRARSDSLLSMASGCAEFSFERAYVDTLEAIH